MLLFKAISPSTRCNSASKPCREISDRPAWWCSSAHKFIIIAQKLSPYGFSAFLEILVMRRWQVYRQPDSDWVENLRVDDPREWIIWPQAMLASKESAAENIPTDYAWVALFTIRYLILVMPALAPYACIQNKRTYTLHLPACLQTDHRLTNMICFLGHLKS